MAQVMELIEQEQKASGLTAEKFAVTVGVTSTTLSRQRNKRQGLGIESVQAYAKYARRVGNITLLRALGAYALDLNFNEIIINPSE